MSSAVWRIARAGTLIRFFPSLKDLVSFASSSGTKYFSITSFHQARRIDEMKFHSHRLNEGTARWFSFCESAPIQPDLLRKVRKKESHLIGDRSLCTICRSPSKTSMIRETQEKGQRLAAKADNSPENRHSRDSPRALHALILPVTAQWGEPVPKGGICRGKRRWLL